MKKLLTDLYKLKHAITAVVIRTISRAKLLSGFTRLFIVMADVASRLP